MVILASASPRRRELLRRLCRAFDVVPSDCLAAHIKRRLPDAEDLKLYIGGLGKASRGTLKTMVEGIAKGTLVRKDGDIEPLEGMNEDLCDFGTGAKPTAAVSWGDVATAFHSTKIPNIEVHFEAVPELARLAKTLVDLVAREVDVDVVLEDRRDLREAVARERARGLESRDAQERRLHDEGHLLLDLEGRERGSDRVDLDLVVGDVRDSVDRQALELEQANGSDDRREHDDQPAVLDREVEQGFEHGMVSVDSQCSCAAAPLPRSALRMNVPSLTNSSPSTRPENTGTSPPTARPIVTARFA